MAQIDIEISNCNNISHGLLSIEKDVLNIKYGMNGTGKSTVSTALDLTSNQKPLTPLKTFGLAEEETANVITSESLGKVLVFNEDFVNTLVFQESTLIEDAFDVFIKTPDYDTRRNALDARLKALKVDIGGDVRVVELRTAIQNYVGKLELNSNGSTLKSNNNLKSILKKENLFNVPTTLQKFAPLISDDVLSINWIDWKSKGEQFDEKGFCPFCSDELQESYATEKTVFKETYKKADAQNLKAMLEFFEKFEIYLLPEKYSALISCVKTDCEEDVIKTLLKSFIVEFEHIHLQIEKIIQFDANVFRDIDIRDLDRIVGSLKIQKTILNFFSSPLLIEIVDYINGKIDALYSEIANLKTEMGQLRAAMQSSIRTCLKDMNTFLNSAGIQYEVNISLNDNGKAMASLLYKKDENSFSVDVIRKHLSWGERNAFALVLFMFYAQSQKPDLIVLDDPISSFDANKKYAIIHRLFSKVRNEISCSFYKKTVLLLTHDFEPIIDFVVVGKLPQEFVSATFIKNINGVLQEETIDKENDIKSVIQELLCHIRNDSLNLVHRITFLRKYYEHHGIEENIDAYNVLSSIIHGRASVTTKDGTPIGPDEYSNGIAVIKSLIPEFDYTLLITDYFNEEKLIGFYSVEQNSYLKILIFRALMEVVTLPEIEAEDTIIKFINESYHIENDYAYYLDMLKFDTVPSYIINSINEFMASKYQQV